jgi:hypothetical protein
MCYTGLVFFTRQYKEQHGIKNTPEGVVLVRMYCTGLLFSLPGSARNTYDIKNTPEGVVRMCHLLFFLPGSTRNTHRDIRH